jgi:hypothetical protein
LFAFSSPQTLGSDKIAKNFALRDCLQKFAGFSHGLDPKATFRFGAMNGWEARESGL